MKAYIHARLDEEERAALEELKQKTGQTDSELVRRGLRLVEQEESRRPSALDLAGRTVGRFTKGPAQSVHQPEAPRGLRRVNPAGILLDTGPLVALLSKNDANHDRARQISAECLPPFRSCEAVIAEACFLLRKVHPAAPADVVALEPEACTAWRSPLTTTGATSKRS